MYDYEQKPITTRAVIANPNGSISFVLPRDEALAVGLHARHGATVCDERRGVTAEDFARSARLRGQTRLVGWLDDAVAWPEAARFDFVMPSPITGFRTPAFPPSMQPMRTDAERIADSIAAMDSHDIIAAFPVWMDALRR